MIKSSEVNRLHRWIILRPKHSSRKVRKGDGCFSNSSFKRIVIDVDIPPSIVVNGSTPFAPLAGRLILVDDQSARIRKQMIASFFFKSRRYLRSAVSSSAKSCLAVFDK